MNAAVDNIPSSGSETNEAVDNRAAAAPAMPGGDTSESFYRHRAPVRLTHWINALCLLFLIGSGLNIFNAHPRLYWGRYGADSDTAFFSIGAYDTPKGTRGITEIGHTDFDTTGVLGWSKVNGQYAAHAWPAWLTIPGFQDLADARHWHFLLAWILALTRLFYLIWSFATRHLQKDIWPSFGGLKTITRSA